MTAAQAQVLQKPASVTIEQLGRYLDVHQAAAGAGCDSAAWAHMGSLERRWWRAGFSETSVIHPMKRRRYR